MNIKDKSVIFLLLSAFFSVSIILQNAILTTLLVSRPKPVAYVWTTTNFVVSMIFLSACFIFGILALIFHNNKNIQHKVFAVFSMLISFIVAIQPYFLIFS